LIVIGRFYRSFDRSFGLRTIFLSFLMASLAFAAGCGGTASSSSGSTTTTTTASGGGSNVLAISVNGGPTANVANGSIYENAAFASATICAPGSTSNCVTIDNLLVDTGSTGLRVFASETASLNLPAVNASNGSAAYDCISYVSGAYMWGTVEKADVTLGSETASGVPIQVIGSSTTGVPASCSNGSTTNENTAALVGANGILGVGLEPTDCYYDGSSVCDPASGLSSPPYPAYYTCSGSTCNPAFIAKASQVANPVALFATDNNGVIVELPAASSPAATLSGSLVFGIGTESNNQLPSSATVFTVACDSFTTVFDGQTFGITDSATCAGPGSFIDSGSNGLFFPNVPNITVCSSSTPAGDLSGLYCPSSSQNYSATNEGEDGTSKSTSFTVANAEELFTNSATASDPVQPTLAGTNPVGYGFDWGLPFFYGVNVYNAIDGQSVPSGAPAAPWWAY
jgi:Protein of unknown function (DUF3443)